MSGGGGDGDDLGEGAAAEALWGDGDDLDGDLHAEGGRGELGEVGARKVGDGGVLRGVVFVFAEGEAAGGGGDLGADGDGGEFADEGGLRGSVGEDAVLSGVQADAVEGLKNDQAAGGGFAFGGGSGLPEGGKAVALFLG